MSENTDNTVMPPAPPADAHPRLHALHAHFSALWQKAKDFEHAVVEGFKQAAAFVEKEAPVVIAGAEAVAAAVPVVGPIAAVVEKVAGEAASLASHLAGHPNSCSCPGCVAVNQVNK